MWRVWLILILGIMGGLNMLMDLLPYEDSSGRLINILITIFVVGVATAFPAAVAFFISGKTRFKLAGINIYRAASDLVLAVGLLAWFYLSLLSDRSEYYEGASHMYVATWPVLLGVIAIVLYLICLLAQAMYWAIKHNKVL